MVLAHRGFSGFGGVSTPYPTMYLPPGYVGHTGMYTRPYANIPGFNPGQQGEYGGSPPWQPGQGGGPGGYNGSRGTPGGGPGGPPYLTGDNNMTG